MKKGFAVEGFIREDGVVTPLQGYDDTELRAKIQTNTDEIDNLDSRVTELEEHGGVEDQTKADKVVGVTAGNLASLDAEGNLQDSGNNPADFAPASGSTEYAAANHNHNNEYAPKIHTHLIDAISGLEEYLAALSARVAALEDAVTPVSWETVEEIILGGSGTAGQNRYSSDDNNLFGLTHYADYRIGDRVRLAGITDTEIVVEGEILAKLTGPDRILLSIDLSSITNNGYHYNLQKVAESNNE